MSADEKYLSMWETQLHYTYPDYSLNNDILSDLTANVSNMLRNITPTGVTQIIKGTEEQSKSEKWRNEKILQNHCLILPQGM